MGTETPKKSEKSDLGKIVSVAFLLWIVYDVADLATRRRRR